MINTESVIKYNNRCFYNFEKNHQTHNREVKKFLKWLNEIIIDKDSTVICGSKFLYKDVEVLCTRVDIRPIPFYTCEVQFKPIDGTKDIGEGIGVPRVLKFVNYIIN